MEQLSLFVSSEGEDLTTDFTIDYNPPIYLNDDSNYEMSLIKSSQYYSWTNISSQQGNNLFEWSANFGAWNTIQFDDGNYTIDEINDKLPTQIQIEPLLALQKIKITMPASHQINFKAGTFFNLLGFNKDTVVNGGENIAPNVADITNGIQSVVVHCDLVDPKLW